MNKLKNAPVGRRTWIRRAVTLAGVPAASAWLPAFPGDAAAAPPPETPRPSGTTINTSDPKAIVDTTAGRVRGFVRNGIYSFKGIPFAASSEGRARFMPPVRPAAWAGIRTAMYYGPTCPQVPRTGWTNDENAFLFQWDDGQPGEDCSRVNVWTPGTGDGRKRPVMVWIHGGGFTAGSGQEQPAYHGENLSRRGDVVVVSLNHRLGVLGYLNLAAYGDQYASSANVGMLDLVTALEWVRDNVAQFGGDPGNVLIFGQSGGGSKVSTLMAMPAAKGLFHKAAVQSGSALRMSTADDSARMAAEVLAQLGLGASQVGQLHDLPAARLVSAMIAASMKFPATPPGRGPMAGRPTWGPTVDGRILPNHPFDPAAPAISAHIPMLIGTVLNESSPSQSDPLAELLTEDEMTMQVAQTFGTRSETILAAARKIYPKVRPVELLSLIARPRTNAILQAERKAAQGAAPAYLYLFAWKTPILDGRPRAFHCSEIPFVFDNTDVAAFATGGGPGPRALAAHVSDAWITFARTGNPSHGGLPPWPAFSTDTGPVMVFDSACAVEHDSDRELRRLVTQG